MEHVLIIEDDARTATFVIGALQQAGYAAAHCRDGEDGLAALLHGGCDVAVVDVMLPKRDGCAWHYKHFDKTPAYSAAESDARAAKRGLWSSPDPINPYTWRKSKR